MSPDNNAEARMAPQTSLGEMSHSDHFVQFYEEDVYLLDEVVRFVAAGLDAGDGIIVIATDAHRDGFEERLRARGVDVSAAVAQGHYMPLDATETLSKFYGQRLAGRAPCCRGVGRSAHAGGGRGRPAARQGIRGDGGSAVRDGKRRRCGIGSWAASVR